MSNQENMNQNTDNPLSSITPNDRSVQNHIHQPAGVNPMLENQLPNGAIPCPPPINQNPSANAVPFQPVPNSIPNRQIFYQHQQNMQYEAMQMSKQPQNQNYTPFSEPQKKKADVEHFKHLGVPSIVYAIIYFICIYRNHSNLLEIIWVAATIAYAFLVIKYLRPDRNANKFSIFLSGVMMLLSVSSFLIDRYYITVLNQIGILLSLGAILLCNLKSMQSWDLSTYLLELLRILGGAFSHIGDCFRDCKGYYKSENSKAQKTSLSIAIGIIITLPIILILCSILMGADQVFSFIVKKILSDLHILRIVARFLLLGFIGFVFSYATSKYFVSPKNTPERKPKIHSNSLIISVVLTSTTILYLFFCFIQIFYLFLHDLELPSGLTYASYARKGFFQLLFICTINLIVVLYVRKHFMQNHYLTTILILISSCTFVMIASSAYRILLYIKRYQLTTLRLFVLIALVVLTLWMLGVMLYIVNKSFPMFQYGTIVLCIIYVLFSFSKPDYIIANYAFTHASQVEEIDLAYLTTLSADAAPVMEYYLGSGKFQDFNSKKTNSEYLYRYYRKNPRIFKSISIFNFNYSRYQARKGCSQVPIRYQSNVIN